MGIIWLQIACLAYLPKLKFNRKQPFAPINSLNKISGFDLHLSFIELCLALECYCGQRDGMS